MNPTLSFIQLNIERAKHLDLVIPFLKERKPDVICIQEIRKNDVSLFEKELGVRGYFSPTAIWPFDGGPFVVGIAIFSKLPLSNFFSEYYYGDGKDLPTLVPTTTTGISHRVLVCCDVEKGGTIFRIGNTHFTWTPDGEVNERQKIDLENFLAVLKKVGELVFMGDFNAPRGLGTFSVLAEKFKDNVPKEYVTSLDRKLHRAGGLDRMVDGVFSTPSYEVTDMEMICGLSDHCALAGNVSKK